MKQNETILKKGLFYKSQRKYQKAIKCFQKVLFNSPNHADAFNNLGATYKEMGKIVEAEKIFSEVIIHQPDYSPAHANLALIFLNKNDFQNARHHSIKAYKDFQTNPDFLFNYGLIMEKLNEFDQAIGLYGKAVQIDPNHYKANVNLSVLKILMGDLSDAEKILLDSIQRFPGKNKPLNNLGLCYEEQGKIQQAIDFYEKAALSEKTGLQARSNLLFTMHYLPDISAEMLYKVHCKWNTFPNNKIFHFENSYDKSDQILNIGYLSPDFRIHPVATFLYPILLNHNRKQFKIFCYAQIDQTDDMTEKIKKLCTNWVDITSLSDEEVCNAIQKDNIQILIDLAGHSKNNRMKIFAMKPAPVQISYLGYPGTTGLKQIDYRITDQCADPKENDSFHTEKLVRMPHCFLCYDPKESMPDISSLPALKNGFITLGSFNRMSKLNDNVLDMWAEIMIRQKNTRLILKAQAFHDFEIKKRVNNFFEKKGVKKNRLILLERIASRIEHLKLYHKIDIALDTFPYHGTATTCQALWMGIPVISLQGKAHVSRVSTSILNTLGLNDFIALSSEEYIDKVCKLSANINLLSFLRTKLRIIFQNSPLHQSKNFVSHLEHQYRKMWQNFLNNEKK